MKRFAPVIFFAATGLVLAQQPAQNSSPGAWRRVDDPPPASAPSVTPTPSAAPDSSRNPEPVARDQYGQTAGQPQPDGPPAVDPDAVTAPAPPPDVMMPPPPAAQSPAPPQQQSMRPSYGLPHALNLKPGTYVTVRMNQGLSSDHNHVGDTFTATLMQPVVVDGIVVAQRGQTVYGIVADVEKHKVDKPSRLQIGLTGMTLVDGTQLPLKSQLVVRQGGTTPAGVQAGTVFGTTAVGAAIGGAAAWGTGAAIGAGAGAAAGIIGVLVTRHHPTVVYPETALTFQVNAQALISTEHSPQAFRFRSAFVPRFLRDPALWRPAI